MSFDYVKATIVKILNTIEQINGKRTHLTNSFNTLILYRSLLSIYLGMLQFVTTLLLKYTAIVKRFYTIYADSKYLIKKTCK